MTDYSYFFIQKLFKASARSRSKVMGIRSTRHLAFREQRNVIQSYALWNTAPQTPNINVLQIQVVMPTYQE
jgi:hypothetical protein